jgi:hypothetical protein
MSIRNIVEVLDREISNLTQARNVLAGLSGSVKLTANGPGKRIVSAASRRKMAAAQKARWAKVRSGKQPSAKPHSTKRPRVMSISARRKIAAAQKARWAKFRAKRAA